MPYCSTALKAKHADETIDLISRIAKEHFRTREAYPLESDGRWNIDAGENDVRAICDEDGDTIKFFCRYQSDIQRTEAKINDFASKYSDACKAIPNTYQLKEA
jgi:hypothetical protein